MCMGCPRGPEGQRGAYFVGVGETLKERCPECSATEWAEPHPSPEYHDCDEADYLTEYRCRHCSTIVLHETTAIPDELDE